MINIIFFDYIRTKLRQRNQRNKEFWKDIYNIIIIIGIIQLMEIISMINIIFFLITSEPNCDKEIKETKYFEKIYITL